MTWQTFGTLAVIFISVTFGQDIMFPDDDRMEQIGGNNNVPITERLPLHVEGRCPPNMLLYPGDGNTSIWECDCRRGFLYFPLNESCHEAYRRGPCPIQQYVVLPPGEVIPKCERNPCNDEGLVPYKNGCHELLKIGTPCTSTSQLTVNETTYAIECTEIDINPFILITAPTNRCPSGSRRNTLGQCRPMI